MVTYNMWHFDLKTFDALEVVQTILFLKSYRYTNNVTSAVFEEEKPP